MKTVHVKFFGHRSPLTFLLQGIAKLFQGLCRIKLFPNYHNEFTLRSWHFKIYFVQITAEKFSSDRDNNI